MIENFEITATPALIGRWSMISALGMHSLTKQNSTCLADVQA